VSNHLAIATVTMALRTLINRATQVIPGAQVSTLRPDMLGQDGMVRGVNLFLYMVTTNPHHANADLPTRVAGRGFVQVPQIALDLLYIVTFHGDDARLEPQLLMGATLATLHESPVLTSTLIAEAISTAPQDALATSDLAQQRPTVTVTLGRSTPDSFARIWQGFQAPYLLSVELHCSVVLVSPTVTIQPTPEVTRVNLEAEPR
jgi:hypothetical protein